MNHYQEITLIANPEIPLHFIWSKLYTQLHLALVAQKDAHDQVPIGVSFPQYKADQRDNQSGGGKSVYCLGAKLRVFAPTEAALQQLDLNQWLNRLLDYVHISSIKAVPTERITGYACFSRYRPHFDLARVAQRFATFKNISLEAALAHCTAHKKPTQYVPFIPLKSETNQQPFRLFIQQTVRDTAHDGTFGLYGLSARSTVPLFG
jgi:CRISPR-associated endonuclease Csy4